ncbi:MAG: class I SAM-dependent methyltransferase [Phycisphaerae bacterium]|nr:class I SAM-dependent methyltransferase [Phycisphaerae bacterium]
MAMKPPTGYSRAVRRTLRWLVADEWVERPLEASGEEQYLLCHAERLHESLRRLPAAGEHPRCLVVGSWGLEVPYLCGRLGWEEVTCLCAPRDKPGRLRQRTRVDPHTRAEYPFTLIEHDIEGSPLPFEPGTFGLVVFWGCFEHLRRDPELSLYEINRVSTPGAVVSLVTDNAISFQATHSMLRGHPMPMRLHWPESEGHWRLYTPREIGELLEGTGWRTDLLTSIVPDAPVYWKWWKRWVFRRTVANLRQGFGLAEPYWNAFVLAHATKVAEPTRSYPTWLYKEERIRQLKVEMLEMVARQAPVMLSA